MLLSLNFHDNLFLQIENKLDLKTPKNEANSP